MCNADLPRIKHPNDVELIGNDKAAKAALTPNPNNCIAELLVKNKYMGDISIELISTTGSIILKEKYIKTGYELRVNINIVNFSTGTYFYRISQNDIKLSDGSFIVIK